MSAVLYSALKITDFSQIWIFPLAFLVFCLIYFLACWLFLWLISLPISMKKEYDKPSLTAVIASYAVRRECESM